MSELNKISIDTKIEILKQDVEPAYKKDVKDLIKGKRCWRITGQTFETMSKVFVAVGSIVSFAAGVYNETNLSFISGAISTISLATLQFASFSYRENKKQSNELNSLLKNIDIAAIPTLERSAEDYTAASMRRSADDTPAKRSENEALRVYLNESEQENMSLRRHLQELESKLIELTKNNENHVHFEASVSRK